MAKEPDLKRDTAYGPYLNAAFLCEKVLEQKDGVLSAIRIVDRLTCDYAVSAEKLSSEIPAVKAELAFLLILKSGQNPGETNIKIVLKKPDNSELPPLNHTIHLDSASNQGGNVVINSTFTFDQNGVWWFEVSINDVSRTRVPLEVIFLRQAMQIHAHKS